MKLVYTTSVGKKEGAENRVEKEEAFLLPNLFTVSGYKIYFFVVSCALHPPSACGTRFPRASGYIAGNWQRVPASCAALP